jgi:hypothetical protein
MPFIHLAAETATRYGVGTDTLPRRSLGTIIPSSAAARGRHSAPEELPVASTIAAESAREEPDRRLVFLSDLHLATDNGKRDFFAEDEFTALLDELIDDHEPIDLIIAGDFFDLLQLTAETPGADRVATFQRAFEQREYEGMLDRLRHFNRQPEHRTIYLLGNHDAESGWNDPLRAYLLDSGIVSEISLAYAHTYGDGLGNGCLIYCEHGNDYDGVNTIIDYRNPSITPLGSHIVTDMVNYLEPLGRHADIDAPTSIADIDNIHPLGLIPWWFISTYFYQQVRRITKYIVVPASVIYLLFHCCRSISSSSSSTAPSWRAASPACRISS